MNVFAKQFLENCFHDVWVLASLENIDRYYSKTVTGIFNGKLISRKDIEEQIIWCKDNEKELRVKFPDVIAEGNKIAFRVQLTFTDQAGQTINAENMMIYHLDEDGKIDKIWKKSNGDITLKKEEGYLDVPGGKIWYQKMYSEGTQDKTPLIALHGGPGVPHNYLNNLTQLAVNNPVVLYDQLGCGKSTIKGEHKKLWVLPRFVEELELLVKHLGFHGIYLLGHSSGATLATEYALKNSHQVKKLILASPFLSAPLWIKDTRYLLEQLPPHVSQVIIKHEKEGTLDSQEYQDATLIFYQHYLCRMREWPEDFKNSFLNLNLSVYQTMFGSSEFTVTGNLNKYDRLNDLHLLKMPTLITCGRFDEARPESMQKIVKLLPHGKLVIFEKSAHLSHLEESERYLNVLTAFIKEDVK